MSATERHQTAEARFIELVEEAALPLPDRIGYEPQAVVFYWDETKTAAIVCERL